MSPFRAALIGLFVPSLALAEFIPPFHLNRRTEQAAVVAHGKLDARGVLTVDATLKGKPGAARITLRNGIDVYNLIERKAKATGPVEVVVYLRKEGDAWHIDGGNAGVVGFVGNGTYLLHMDTDLRWGASFARHPTLVRHAFLTRARDAITAVERRRALAVRAPSAARLRDAVRFLQALPAEDQPHHTSELSRTWHPLPAVEEKTLVGLLNASPAAGRPLLLDLLGSTARSRAAFDAAAGLLDRKQPPATRAAAIDALARIDTDRAAGRLAAYLSADDPQLRGILHVLLRGDPFRLSPALVGPLRKLMEDVRVRQRLDRQALGNESYALAHVIGHHAHPRLLPAFAEWVRADDHVTANQVSSEIKRWVGLCPRDNARAWDAWWARERHLIEAAYPLGNAAGRDRWYRAYRAGSATTRRVLMRLWAFELALPEAALAREAGGDGGDVAKVVLAALWKHRRLSAATRGDLVARFLTLRLEEVPGRPVGRWRELRVVSDRSFPFPQEAWVEHQASIAVGKGERPRIDGSFGSSSLGSGRGPHPLGTMGGAYPGSPEARAEVVVREVAHHDGGKVVWSRRWSLGPVRLPDAK